MHSDTITQEFDRFDIPLRCVSEEHIRVYNEWQRLNDELEQAISSFIQETESSSFPLSLNLDRFRLAVGLSGEERLGLVFESMQQQQDFIGDLQECMEISGYPSFTLVATGSSFQGLSTNPVTFKRLGYMKYCGETRSTDLDLQIYCSQLFKESSDKKCSAFKNHFIFRKINGRDFARLSTFNNKCDPHNATPYRFIPLLKRLEVEWTQRLRRNFLFERTGRYFEEVSIALMTMPDYVQSHRVGSPYVLYQA